LEKRLTTGGIFSGIKPSKHQGGRHLRRIRKIEKIEERNLNKGCEA